MLTLLKGVGSPCRVCIHVQCSDKPAEADKYGFSNFARMLMSGKGLNPLPSDSRRRPDRTALEVSPFSKRLL
jgi:hypothetical protein